MNAFLPDEAATLALAAALYDCLPIGGVVFLQGSLGAGKTTFVRGYLRAAGHTGVVKSPTFTLVEPYLLADRSIYHFDLYRLDDPEELEWIGIRDYLQAGATCFIEWAERGVGFLPKPDLTIALAPEAGGRRIDMRAAESCSGILHALSHGL